MRCSATQTESQTCFGSDVCAEIVPGDRSISRMVGMMYGVSRRIVNIFDVWLAKVAKFDGTVIRFRNFYYLYRAIYLNEIGV